MIEGMCCMSVLPFLYTVLVSSFENVAWAPLQMLASHMWHWLLCDCRCRGLESGKPGSRNRVGECWLFHPVVTQMYFRTLKFCSDFSVKYRQISWLQGGEQFIPLHHDSSTNLFLHRREKSSFPRVAFGSTALDSLSPGLEWGFV